MKTKVKTCATGRQIFAQCCDFRVSTYLNSVENDCYDVSMAYSLAVLLPIIVTSVSELAVIEGPAFLTITESLQNQKRIVRS